MKYLSYRTDILTRQWNIYYMPNKQFIKKYGDKTLAVAECDEREIYLRVNYISVESTIHELMHAYIHEHSAPTMDLSPEQVEELCCDIVAKYGLKMCEQANEISSAYKALRYRRHK